MEKNNEVAVVGNQQEIASSLLFEVGKFAALEKIAEIMASGKSTIPKHLVGSVADCFAVAMQAAQWGMNPFAVAQKTYLVNGVLGYEAQLVNAVITASNAIRGHFHFEYKWEDGAPDGLVKCGAVMKNETEITWGEWLDTKKVTTKNSPLWKTAPKQQAGYLAIKYWSRLYSPAQILGVYTPDELEEKEMKNITPPASISGGTTVSALKEKLAPKKTKEVKKSDVETKPSSDALLKKEVERESATKPQKLSEIVQAEIERTDAPVTLKNVCDFLKYEKKITIDLDKISEDLTLVEIDEYIRNNTASLISFVADWESSQNG